MPLLTLPAGDDLRLVLLEIEHARPLFRLVESDRPHLEEWLDWLREVRTIQQMEAYILRSAGAFAAGSQAHFGIWSGGVLAGTVTVERLDPRNRTAELGYWLGRAYIGGGLMTRAVRRTCAWLFREREMNRVEIRCEADNLPSGTVALRSGFTREGTLRQAGFRNGHYRDHHVFGLLREEWESRTDTEFFPCGMAGEWLYQ